MKIYLESIKKDNEILPVNLRSVVDHFANDHQCRDTVNVAQLMESMDAPWLVQYYVI